MKKMQKNFMKRSIKFIEQKYQPRRLIGRLEGKTAALHLLKLLWPFERIRPAIKSDSRGLSVTSLSASMRSSNSGKINFSDQIPGSCSRSAPYQVDSKTGHWISSKAPIKILIDENHQKTAQGWYNIIHPDERKRHQTIHVMKRRTQASQL